MNPFMKPMRLAESRITAQGQISVPVEVRRRLGLSPGGIIEWDTEGDVIVVRRAARCSSEDIHRALFPKGPPKWRSFEELKAGIANYVRAKHASR